MKIQTKIFKNGAMKTFAKTIAFCGTLLFISCNSSTEKLEDSKENVIEANEDLNEAQREYAEDVKSFKMEVNQKITENDRKIEEINSKIDNSNNKLKAEYENQVAILKRNNEELKMKVGNYEADSKENWDSFKSEFNEDLDKLGTALKNFTVEN